MRLRRGNSGWISRLLCLLGAVICLGGSTLMLMSGRHMMSDARLVIYGIVPMMLGFSLLALVAVPRDARITALAVLIASGLGIFGAETYLAFNPEYVRFKFRGEVPVVPVDERSRTALPHSCGANFLPDGLALPDGTRVLPLGGVAANFLALEDNDPAKPRYIDDFGFNNPPGQWPIGGSTGELAMLAVGDSFTFGTDVAPGQGFSDILRKYSGSLVNLGCGGNGPLLELAAFSEYGPALKPKLALWFYYEENDLPKDILEERQSPILMAYLDGKTQGLLQRRDELDAALRLYLSERRESEAPAPATGSNAPNIRDISFLRSLRSSLGLVGGFDPDSLELLGRSLQQARALAESWQGRLVFVYLPGPTRYTNPVAGIDADGFKAHVLARANKAGLPVVDIDTAFRRHGNPISLFRGHYNEAGYRLVAETVIEELPAISAAK